jgi:hypothetical protein
MTVERRNILLFHAVLLLWLWRSFIADIEFKVYHNTEAYTLYEKKSPRVSLDIRQTENNLNYVSDRNAILIFKCIIL